MKERLTALAIGTVAGLIIVAAMACGTLIASPYEAKQLECVDDASTRAQADACRCKVKAQYGNPCTDAGADQ
jgi:hypothetical protein